MHEGHPQNTGQMVGSIQVMLQCPLQPANSGNYGAAMLFVAGMQRARWDARCTLGCVVHAGMRGSRDDDSRMMTRGKVRGTWPPCIILLNILRDIIW